MMELQLRGVSNSEIVQANLFDSKIFCGEIASSQSLLIMVTMTRSWRLRSMLATIFATVNNYTCALN